MADRSASLWGVRKRKTAQNTREAVDFVLFCVLFGVVSGEVPPQRCVALWNGAGIIRPLNNFGEIVRDSRENMCLSHLIMQFYLQNYRGGESAPYGVERESA